MLPIVMVVFVVMLIAKPPAHFILKIVGLIVATFYYLLAVQFMAQLNMWVAVVFVVAMAVALVWRTHLGWGKWWENL